MKTLGVVSVLLLTLLLANLSAGEAQARLQPGELCSDHSDAAIATFEDANLETAIRAAFSVGAQDDLTCGLVAGLTDLEARDAGIESLVGIQNLTSLTTLYLVDNPITDISALSGLTSLTTLWLFRNSITDISALSGLTSVTDLRLGGNSITDIRALRRLTSLTVLYLHNNSITDISALSGLTSLTFLHLDNNSIIDISALRRPTERSRRVVPRFGLTSLTFLFLHDNPDLTDVRPLLDNTGLGLGDQVFLMNTNVSCTEVAALEAEGVVVDSDCP